MTAPLTVEVQDRLPLLREVVGHHRPVPFILTREMFGGLPVELAGAEISSLVDQPVAETHVHGVPEVYLLFAPNPGDAEISVEVEDEEFLLTAPAALYVPAGKRHRFVTRRAVPGSFCFGLFVHSPEPGEKEER
ncbi:cupin domain-containing protein [Kitasatospora sp. NPDC056446]|uniref:cupin domain-containing protein n=1 Tax=Kitasatospora sp. NPDC056446 TaxID=3345819 RepID=UPI0036B6A4B4